MAEVTAEPGGPQGTSQRRAVPAAPAQIRPPSTGKPTRPTGRTFATARTDRTALRQQQLDEYRKRCQDSCLPANSGILKELQPSESNTTHEYNFSTLHLGDRQLKSLAGALGIDKKLVAVRVPGTGLMDAGMVAVCEELKKCPLLEHVDVSRNRFSMKGAEACLSLVQGAERLVLLRAEDTVLDAEFCVKRGLRSEYVSLRKQIEGILAQRLEQANLPKGWSSCSPGSARTLIWHDGLLDEHYRDMLNFESDLHNHDKHSRGMLNFESEQQNHDKHYRDMPNNDTHSKIVSTNVPEQTKTAMPTDDQIGPLHCDFCSNKLQRTCCSQRTRREGPARARTEPCPSGTIQAILPE